MFATREVWPFVAGGGIGRAVVLTAAALTEVADVTVLTTSRFREEYEAMRSADDQRLPERVQFAWADEPSGDLRPFWSAHHAWSVSLFQAVRELSADLVEFDDYQGAAAVTLDARRTGDRALADTKLVVRLHTTYEIVSVLNHTLADDLETRTLAALERAGLRFADAVLCSAEEVARYYDEFYGRGAVAGALQLPQAFEPGPADPQARLRPSDGGPVRVLYLGRLERRKGVAPLVEGVVALDRDDVELTLVGGDTDTAPGGGSMRRHLESLAVGDPRIRFLGRVEHTEVAPLVQRHHIVAAPSLWEAYSNVVREALAANRPVLASPVGGMVQAIVPGRSGWPIPEPTPEAVREVLAALPERRAEIEAMIVAGTPRAVLEETLDNDAVRRDYAELAAKPSRRPAAPRHPPEKASVHAVVRAVSAAPLAATLASLDREAGGEQRVTVVADSLDRFSLGVLARVADVRVGDHDQAVRAVAEGAEAAGATAVLLLEAGDVVGPAFVARAVAALLAEPGLAYVTAFSKGWNPSCVPLNNVAADLIGEDEVPPGVLLVRARTLLDKGLENLDDGLPMALARHGAFGAVIPEVLIDRRRRQPRTRPQTRRAMLARPGTASTFSRTESTAR